MFLVPCSGNHHSIKPRYNSICIRVTNECILPQVGNRTIQPRHEPRTKTRVTHTSTPYKNPGEMASRAAKKPDKSVISMPKELNEKRIPANLSINALMGFLSFVTQGKPDGTDDWRTLFSLDPPNASLEQLFQVCVLPPEELLEKVLANYTKISSNSVMDWSWKKLGKEVCYPLTVLAIYREYGRANKTRKLWRDAQEWMGRWSRKTNGMEAAASLAERLTCTLEWDTHIRAAGMSVHTNDLLSMLSDEWMTDSQLDLVLQVLTERLGDSSRGSESIIAPCIFFQHIKNSCGAQSKKKQLTIPLLDHYKTAFLSGTKKYLYFISLVGHNHFVAWRIDYSAATLCHGECNHKKFEEMKTDKSSR